MLGNHKNIRFYSKLQIIRSFSILIKACGIEKLCPLLQLANFYTYNYSWTKVKVMDHIRNDREESISPRKLKKKS